MVALFREYQRNSFLGIPEEVKKKGPKRKFSEIETLTPAKSVTKALKIAASSNFQKKRV